MRRKEKLQTLKKYKTVLLYSKGYNNENEAKINEPQKVLVLRNRNKR